MKEQKIVPRFPRGLGITQLALQANAGDDEALKNLTKFVIHTWIVNNGKLWSRVYSVNELADFLKCEPSIIQMQMKQTFLDNGLFDRNKMDEIADSLMGACIGWALEDRMEISQQLQILRDSQGGRYAPFITAEVNKAIGLKQQSTTSLQSLVRAVSGGGTVNIFNQQNNQFNNTDESEPVLTRDIAMSMIQKELADKGGIKEIEYVENQYDFKELPVVVATKQEGNRGDKEGLTLNKAELDSVTGDYHGALKVFEEDHHQIRREIEEGIDYEEIDPELEDNH
jgi:hypothetical protein